MPRIYIVSTGSRYKAFNSTLHCSSLLFQALNVTVTLLPAGHCPGSVMYVGNPSSIYANVESLPYIFPKPHTFLKLRINS